MFLNIKRNIFNLYIVGIVVFRRIVVFVGIVVFRRIDNIPSIIS